MLNQYNNVHYTPYSQSMSSDYPDVLRLVGALATKVSESLPDLSAQAIGSALYGLQKLSSDKLEVRNFKKKKYIYMYIYWFVQFFYSIIFFSLLIMYLNVIDSLRSTVRYGLWLPH